MSERQQSAEGGNGAALSARVDEARSRARLLGLLASLFREQPSCELLKHLRKRELQAIFSELDVDLGVDFRTLPVEQLAEQLAVEFTELFLLPGYLISPHESVQVPGGKGLLRGPETTFVANYYKTAGFELDDSTPMEPDHVSIELEFFAHLATLEADSLQQENLAAVQQISCYQKDFLQRHLGRWSAVFLNKVADVTKAPFYREIALLTRDFLDQELDRLAGVVL